MQFLELAKSRFSVRQYQKRKVEEEKLLKILEAGRVAPTAANRQPQRLLVIQENEGLEKVAKATRFFGAPLVIIVCGNHNEVWTRRYDNKQHVDVDTSIVTDHMMLQATELGLGSVWICQFNPDIIRQEFSLPDYLEPVSILAVGYNDGNISSAQRYDTERKPLDETVFFERYSESE